MKYIKSFEKKSPNATFNVKGKDVVLDLSYNKVINVSYLRSLNLSYEELVDSDIWSHIAISQRKESIGNSYSFMKYNISQLTGQWYSEINNKEITNCIGKEIVCINDKPGPYGGKPTITEGKTYILYGYSPILNKEKCKIKNDTDHMILISPERFCKSDTLVKSEKYNL